MNGNERKSRVESPPKKAAIAAVVIAIGLLAIVLLAFSCTSSAPANDADAANTLIMTQPNNMGESSEENTKIASPDTVAEIEGDATNSDTAAEQTTGSQGTEAPDSTPQVSTPGQTMSSSNSAPAQPQKTWVEKTERVWVVDKEAWTESVPIYSTVEVSICNICGTDITGSTSAHAKEHMKAGEGSGHHSETRQIITSYNTVSHKEEGHWETRVVGGHWE